ncbi:endonuclease domain-containing protein [Ferruginibacter sp. HRS2-29]|uniref:endonuclease domain-containing protein n=1 Tax=Ferruginibacter sp. HRS2-29 TaxID=2487334 RepID=UPI0020CEF815|nr:DUF559 domain-containing protein [Ferruginibacter sp. HRS2-29]MCP9752036.1 DUF559 domain-containing protein [Ferruginibacter sp. HRS2-29]
MLVENFKIEIQRFELEKFEKNLKLCNSPIEEIFVGKIYSFFLKHGVTVNLITQRVNEFVIVNDTFFESVYFHSNRKGLKIKLNHSNSEHVDPLTGEPERICGFQFTCGDVSYRIFPQYPIFNHEKLYYADFVIKVYDRKNVNVGDFVIECDGFAWHNTKEQLERDNSRSRFITLNGYKILRYTGSEINRIDDEFIIQLENTIYQSIFNKESNLYILKKY